MGELAVVPRGCAVFAQAFHPPAAGLLEVTVSETGWEREDTSSKHRVAASGSKGASHP